MFDAVKVKNDCVEWICNWFKENGPGCNAVIGISGGKDSSIVAALCVEALGRERVIGVLMPQGEQHDIDKSYLLAKHLRIRALECDISNSVRAVQESIQYGFEGTKISDMRELNPDSFPLSDQTMINLPPRIRMATLYAISQTLNGRVSNNCNLSEDWVGYSTRWGDSVGDFSPLSNLTVTEVKQIGYTLNLPADLIEKTPDDGLCGKTDEDNLGFSYETLDRYIRTGICEDPTTKARIDALHKKNQFKLHPMPSFPYDHT